MHGSTRRARLRNPSPIAPIRPGHFAFPPPAAKIRQSPPGTHAPLAHPEIPVHTSRGLACGAAHPPTGEDCPCRPSPQLATRYSPLTTSRPRFSRACLRAYVPTRLLLQRMPNRCSATWHPKSPLDFRWRATFLSVDHLGSPRAHALGYRCGAAPRLRKRDIMCGGWLALAAGLRAQAEFRESTAHTEARTPRRVGWAPARPPRSPRRPYPPAGGFSLRSQTSLPESV